jgi:hypothetical protein
MIIGIPPVIVSEFVRLSGVLVIRFLGRQIPRLLSRICQSLRPRVHQQQRSTRPRQIALFEYQISSDSAIAMGLTETVAATLRRRQVAGGSTAGKEWTEGEISGCQDNGKVELRFHNIISVCAEIIWKRGWLRSDG